MPANLATPPKERRNEWSGWSSDDEVDGSLNARDPLHLPEEERAAVATTDTTPPTTDAIPDANHPVATTEDAPDDTDTDTDTDTSLDEAIHRADQNVQQRSHHVAVHGDSPKARQDVETLRNSLKRIKPTRTRRRSKLRGFSQSVDGGATVPPPTPSHALSPPISPTMSPPISPTMSPPISPTISTTRSTLHTAAANATTAVQSAATYVAHHLSDAITASNNIERSITGSVHEQIEHTSRWVHGIVFYVLKAFVLVCLVVYTFAVDIGRCECAANFRKPLIQWGGLLALMMVLVAIVYPQVYATVPALKVAMLLLTLVVAYGVVTYFPILRDKGCRCAGGHDWMRWVVEYSVFVVLALLLLGVGGVSVM